MKTSTKAILLVLGTFSVAGAFIAITRPATADEAPAQPSQSVTEALPEMTLDNDPPPPSWGQRERMKLVLDGGLFRESGGTCSMSAPSTDDWSFFDYLPIQTVIEVPNGVCTGSYVVELRLWISTSQDAADIIENYDLALRYPMELGYGYLLGHRN